MAKDAVDDRSAPPLLTLGRVDVLKVQVGYRAGPEDPAHEQFLLDLPLPEAGPILDEQQVLAALEPVLHVDGGAPRHYSLHQHRWHTSWGASPGAWEIGLLVSTGTEPGATSPGPDSAVIGAFRDLLAAVGRPEQPPTSRDAAVLRARRSAETAYGLSAASLSLSAEQHDPVGNSWTVRLRTTSGDAYDVVVGLVDGDAASVLVRCEGRMEVFDAVGAE